MAPNGPLARRFVRLRGEQVTDDLKWAWSPDLVRIVLETTGGTYDPEASAVKQAREAEKALKTLWGSKKFNAEAPEFAIPDTVVSGDQVRAWLEEKRKAREEAAADGESAAPGARTTRVPGHPGVYQGSKFTPRMQALLMDLERALTAEDADREALRQDLEDAANEIPLGVETPDSAVLRALQMVWALDTTESRGAITPGAFTDPNIRLVLSIIHPCVFPGAEVLSAMVLSLARQVMDDSGLWDRSDTTSTLARKVNREMTTWPERLRRAVEALERRGLGSVTGGIRKDLSEEDWVTVVDCFREWRPDDKGEPISIGAIPGREHTVLAHLPLTPRADLWELLRTRIPDISPLQVWVADTASFCRDLDKAEEALRALPPVAREGITAAAEAGVHMLDTRWIPRRVSSGFGATQSQVLPPSPVVTSPGTGWGEAPRPALLLDTFEGSRAVARGADSVDLGDPRGGQAGDPITVGALIAMGPAPKEQAFVGLLQACGAFGVDLPQTLDSGPAGWEMAVRVIDRALRRKGWRFTASEGDRTGSVGAHLEAILDIVERRADLKEAAASDAGSVGGGQPGPMSTGHHHATDTVAAIHKAMALSMAATESRKGRGSAFEVPKCLVMPSTLGQQVATEYANPGNPAFKALIDAITSKTSLATDRLHRLVGEKSDEGRALIRRVVVTHMSESVQSLYTPLLFIGELKDELFESVLSIVRARTARLDLSREVQALLWQEFLCMDFGATPLPMLAAAAPTGWTAADKARPWGEWGSDVILAGFQTHKEIMAQIWPSYQPQDDYDKILTQMQGLKAIAWQVFQQVFAGNPRQAKEAAEDVMGLALEALGRLWRDHTQEIRRERMSSGASLPTLYATAEKRCNDEPAFVEQVRQMAISVERRRPKGPDVIDSHLESIIRKVRGGRQGDSQPRATRDRDAWATSSPSGDRDQGGLHRKHDYDRAPSGPGPRRGGAEPQGDSRDSSRSDRRPEGTRDGGKQTAGRAGQSDGNSKEFRDYMVKVWGPENIQACVWMVLNGLCIKGADCRWADYHGMSEGEAARLRQEALRQFRDKGGKPPNLSHDQASRSRKPAPTSDWDSVPLVTGGGWGKSSAAEDEAWGIPRAKNSK